MVPLLDLKREYASMKLEIDTAVASVMADTKYINGPQVKQFEEAAADGLRQGRALVLPVAQLRQAGQHRGEIARVRGFQGVEEFLHGAPSCLCFVDS